MKNHQGKIRDQEPHEVEVSRHYSRAIFWAAFAFLVSLLAILSEIEGEVYFVPLFVGLAALGVIFAIQGIQQGDE